MKRNCIYELLQRNVLILFSLFVSIYAYAYDFKSNGLCYNILDNRNVELTWEELNKPYVGDIVIPETVLFEGVTYNVSRIGSFSFLNIYSHSGSSYNWYDNTELKSVTIPQTVESIGSYAFANCKSIETVVFPNRLKTIEFAAFRHCSLLSYVFIPQGLSLIEDAVFSYCTSLVKIEVDKSNNHFCAINGVLFSSDKTTLLSYPAGGSVNYTVPEGTSIVSTYAFEGCSNLESISMPSTLTEIKRGAFWNCTKLSKVKLLSVNSLGFAAFRYCTNLEKIDLPSNLSIINGAVFSYCYNLKEINISNNNYFSSERGVLYSKDLDVLYLYPCGKEDKEYVVNNNTSILFTSSFEGCTILKKIIIPEKLKEIKQGAFWNCTYLEEVNFPSYLTNIESQAFQYCVSLKAIKSELINPINIYKNVFPDNVYSDAVLYVPVNTLNNYTSVTPWNSFENIFEQEAREFSMTISAIGNGVVSYDNYSIKSKISSFKVTECSSVTISFTPDNGYRVKTVKVNDSDVTSDIINNKYTLSDIRSNTSVEVEFEAIPSKTYTLTIKATGNGSASYDGNTIRDETKTFTVTEGSDVTITFTPDEGYRIKSAKASGTNISNLSKSLCSISNFKNNESVEVEFEAIPIYTLSIKATGNGFASYEGNTIRKETKSFTVTEGFDATITFTPNDGYQIKTVKVNGSTVTISNNEYKISSISKDTTVEVEFEAKEQDNDIAKDILVFNSGGSIMQTNNLINSGSLLYWTFSNNSSVSVTLKSLQLIDGETGTEGNKMAVDVVVEAGESVSYSTKIGLLGIHIPVTCRFWYEYNGIEYYADAFYRGMNNLTLTIKAFGAGIAEYNGSSIRNQTSNFDVETRSSVTITFTPDNGCWIKDVKVNGSSVSISNNQCTISSISENTTVEVEFVEKLNSFESDGINYSVVSGTEKTVCVAAGSYGKVLVVPATVNYQDVNWTVIGVDKGALNECKELAAIIWNPDAAFTESVDNPNMLLYVKSSGYAPTSIKNVVVNGSANSIILSEATEKNDFYCPQEFTAQKVSYSHHYKMETGFGNARGWETIALPFDVQKITHQSKGEIVPYANWKSGDDKKPFWLMTYGNSGWTDANSIKANTPYIISMPNHSYYKPEFRLNGNVTFSAENVVIPTSKNIHTVKYNGRTFVPNYMNQTDNSYYSLNVNNDYVTYDGSDVEGSKFFIGLRPVHPFEAYMTTTSNSTRSIAISDDMTTGIEEITTLLNEQGVIRVYNLQGQQLKIEAGKNIEDVKRLLPTGVYIINGKKQIIK